MIHIDLRDAMVGTLQPAFFGVSPDSNLQEPPNETTFPASHPERDQPDPAFYNLRVPIRHGSACKLFTWTAVMQLVEQDKIDLQADVNTYLTDFQIPAAYPQPITDEMDQSEIHQIQQHGLKDKNHPHA